jgi:hypothetical protein
MYFLRAIAVVIFTSIANLFSFVALCFLYIGWVFIPPPKPPFEWPDD